MKSLKPISLVLAMLVCFIAVAQEKTIKGTVSDANSVLLPGARVKNQKTGKEATANFDGKYSIGAQKGDTLVFSSVGYQIQRKAVKNKNVIKVQLTDSPALPEALGYNPEITNKKQTRQFLPVKDSETKDLNAVPSNNEPLYIVDGVPVKSQQIAKINPNDIDNISVLKEIAATNLYGLRAYYGAIIISTKNEVYKNLTEKEIEDRLNKMAVPYLKEQNNEN